MPVYEYTCESCGKVTEALRRIADADAPIACEACGSDQTSRAHSVVAVSSGKGESFEPPPGCGRCGDPRGACGM